MLIEVNDLYSGAPVTILHGATRTVILVNRWAIKLPSLRYGWRPFLRGLIANAIEREWWWSSCNAGLCPIVCSLPGGWLVVMRRAEPVVNVDRVYAEFVQRDGWTIPAENKDDSFGWLDGHLVAVDYGD